MPALDETPESQDAVHLLLIGDTKSGKSTYAAEAAIAGFNVIYIDADNGLSALRRTLKDHPEAMKRVYYIRTANPVKFIKGFLRSNGKAPFKWAVNSDRQWTKTATNLKDDDVVMHLDITKLPNDTLMVVDSWTAVAMDALGIGNVGGKAGLLEGTDQGIYGEANANLTYICNLMQDLPFHCLVQCHATVYEMYEKPKGVKAGQAKQKDMTLRDVTEVPLSSSRPHGQVMASRFNEIGWLSVDGMGRTEIDFTRRPGRVGGGTMNKKGLTKDIPFAMLAPAPSGVTLAETGWNVELPIAEVN